MKASALTIHDQLGIAFVEMMASPRIPHPSEQFMKYGLFTVNCRF